MKKLSNLSAEKISQCTLYILISVAVVVFALFFFVGYDMPFIDNPDFNAPLFTDLLLAVMVLFLLMTAGLTGYAFLHSSKLNQGMDKTTNGIPSRKLSRTVWLGTLAIMIVCFVFGSSLPMKINGEEYADSFWLRTSDMFVSASLLLLIGAIGAVIFGATRYIRKRK